MLEIERDISLIRNSLERGWNTDTAHAKYNSATGSPAGQCLVSALYAFAQLKHYAPVIVRGKITGIDNSHYWLEVGDKIIDFTADQFDGYSGVLFSSYELSSEYVPRRRFNSSLSFGGNGISRRLATLCSRIENDTVVTSRLSEL